MAAESWLEVPPESDFSLDNVPFGICSFGSSAAGATLAPSSPRCCTAIGGHVIDLHLLAEAGLLDELRTADSMEARGGGNSDGGGGGGERGGPIIEFHPRVVFGQSTLNSFMSHGRPTWVAVRDRLIALFLSKPREARRGGTALKPDGRLRDDPALRSAAIRPMETATFHLPAEIGDYTDFYSSREHATNVGIMFRGEDNALQPNWLHMPIGYHGRSSTVYPSLSRPGDDPGSDGGSDKGETAGRERGHPMATVRRPCGQLQADPSDPSGGSTYGPTRLLDFELEVAFLLGGPTNPRGQLNDPGRPLTVDEARDRIFGYVLMNDWSARDVQKWEYVPLGPFGSKSFATTVSTWVVTPMALEAFRCRTSAGGQGGPRARGGGTEPSGGVDVGGPAADDDPTPLEYLRDGRYGSYDMELTVDIRPSPPTSRAASTTVCRSNLRNLVSIFDYACLQPLHADTHNRKPSVLDAGPAARSPQRDRLRDEAGRPPRERDDIGQGQGELREHARAELEGDAARGAGGWLHANIPPGRRRGRHEGLVRNEERTWRQGRLRRMFGAGAPR